MVYVAGSLLSLFMSRNLRVVVKRHCQKCTFKHIQINIKVLNKRKVYNDYSESWSWLLQLIWSYCIKIESPILIQIQVKNTVAMCSPKSTFHYATFILCAVEEPQETFFKSSDFAIHNWGFFRNQPKECFACEKKSFDSPHILTPWTRFLNPDQ